MRCKILTLLLNQINLIIFKYKNPTCRLYDIKKMNSTIILNQYVVLFDNVTLFDVNIGSYTYIQSNTNIFNCEIGNFCSIAGNVTIGLAAHPTQYVSTHPVFFDNTQPLPFFFTNSKKFTDTLPRTIIGSDVWIGQGVMIKAGIKVGHGSIIAAGAVVIKDVEPYSVVGGIPSKILKYRFSTEIVSKLLELRWWNKDEEELKVLADYFDNPRKLISFIEKNEC